MTVALPLPDAGTVVTVGSFDGVHIGHGAVLREIAARARAAGRASVLVTFEPHPMEIVNPAAAPLLLTTPVERREILAQSELDYAVILRFDERLRLAATAVRPDRTGAKGSARACASVGPCSGTALGRPSSSSTSRTTSPTRTAR